MRTRSQSKEQQKSSSREESHSKPSHGSERQRSCLKSTNDATLTDISRDAVGKLLKRVKSRGLQGKDKEDSYLHQFDALGQLGTDPRKDDKQVAVTKISSNTSDAENCSNTGIRNDQSVQIEVVKGDCFEHANPEMEDEMNDFEWEVGLIPTLKDKDNCHADTTHGMIIEFDTPAESTKRKPTRRASVEDKEWAELVHKVHLLCLVGRGRLVDSACDDPFIQAALLSLLPAHFLNIAEVEKVTAKALDPLVSWFHNHFQIRGSSNIDRPFHSALALAIETRECTPEEVVALSVALLRALNFTTRFVSILDACPLKADVDRYESCNIDGGRTGKNIFNSSTLMVDRSSQDPMSSIRESVSDVGESSLMGACNTRTSKLQCLGDLVHDKLGDKKLDSLGGKVQNDASDLHFSKKPEGLKRKGDIEFEMQMEMALSSTALGSSNSYVSSNVRESCHTSSIVLSPLKRLKKVLAGQSSTSTQCVSIAIGSRKIGAPLYWAEVFCSGENLTGKWVHVDVVNAIIDGEEKVEAAAAACRTSLRYVVAFAGHGAKDVTRRYCTKWYKIASQRVNSIWWDAVLAPLKELESGATGGMVHLNQGMLDKPENLGPCSRPSCEGQDNVSVPVKSTMVLKEYSDKSSLCATRTSLEDMELETRALTEPLPTNQQAYKNHPLYVIERWLTRYQVLHPKGPVLGFCSGHAVYPRTCVQILHTKEKWLQEGLQVRENELPVPAKVLKRTLLKLSKGQACDGDDFGDGVPEKTVVLYGKWQTEPLCLPHAVDGIVPKNERGQVDVWSEKCLPPGTVHLRFPRVASVAKRLEIDYAPAMVGFEFQNGRSVPVFNGIVVCTEFKNVILEAYLEEEEKREAEEKRRNERQARVRWYQLLSSIVTRQRLNSCYGNGASFNTSINFRKEEDKCDGDAPATVNDDGSHSPKCQEGITKDTPQPEHIPTEDHEHVFFTVDESFDASSSSILKRCKCGFSIEVEEF